MIWWISAGLSWGSSVLMMCNLWGVMFCCKLAQGRGRKREGGEVVAVEVGVVVS